MNRSEVANKIGLNYLTTNIENDEFSYSKVLDNKIEGHKYIDRRFEYENYSILVEFKDKKNNSFSQNEEQQILDYYELEKRYKPKNHIILILYNIQNENIKVWKDGVELKDESTINSMDYYTGLYTNRINDKNNVIETTNSLNMDLHKFGIKENIRSQLVGSFLVALNSGLEYSTDLKTKELLERIKEKLQNKIDDNDNKQLKIKLLIKILDEQQVKELKIKDLVFLLNKININLIPYINQKTTEGEDLLNLFFTTFNKYVGKQDKNQAFTPTHITDFMCEVCNVDKNSRVLDPTCGSGAFLVQAMTKMLKKAGKDQQKCKDIKSNQIFGIESEEKAFGLATTNMLIHEDGKSNIKHASCFDEEDWIKQQDINIVLMNPPFNGQKMPSNCPINKQKNMDSTKGFYFVEYVASVVNKGKLAAILPLSCAIGSDDSIKQYKKKMLKNHTLLGVFTLNNEVFHPGASVNACVMLFELGKPHDPEKETFFGYFKNDGFIKKKNKGRVEKENWNSIKKEWLHLFEYKESKPGLSVMHKINYQDEWLAEAYLETDYEQLTEENFIQSIRDYIAFKVKNGHIDE